MNPVTPISNPTMSQPPANNDGYANYGTSGFSSYVEFGSFTTIDNTQWNVLLSWGDQTLSTAYPYSSGGLWVGMNNSGNPATVEVHSFHTYAHPGTYTTTMTVTNIQNPSISGTTTGSTLVS